MPRLLFLISPLECQLIISVLNVVIILYQEVLVLIFVLFSPINTPLVMVERLVFSVLFLLDSKSMISLMVATVFLDTKFLRKISVFPSLTRLAVRGLMLCKMAPSVFVHLELIILVESARYVLAVPFLTVVSVNNRR